MLNRLVVILIIIFLPVSAFATQVYKWTDAEGKVHFTATPPPSSENTAAVEVKNYAGGASASKTLSADEQAVARGFETALSKTYGDATLNCSAAMENLSWQFDTMEAQGKRNLDSGYITQANYNQVMNSMRQARNSVSLSKCQSATGAEKSFYQCMSNDKNHMVGCGKKYNF